MQLTLSSREEAPSKSDPNYKESTTCEVPIIGPSVRKKGRSTSSRGISSQKCGVWMWRQKSSPSSILGDIIIKINGVMCEREGSEFNYHLQSFGFFY